MHGRQRKCTLWLKLFYVFIIEAIAADITLEDTI